MSAVQATIPDEVAAKVAADVAQYGEGWVRFDREGRASHEPWSLIGGYVEMKRNLMRRIRDLFKPRMFE